MKLNVKEEDKYEVISWAGRTGQDIECEPQQSSHVSASPSLPLSLSLKICSFTVNKNNRSLIEKKESLIPQSSNRLDSLIFNFHDQILALTASFSLRACDSFS